MHNDGNELGTPMVLLISMCDDVHLPPPPTKWLNCWRLLEDIVEDTTLSFTSDLLWPMLENESWGRNMPQSRNGKLIGARNILQIFDVVGRGFKLQIAVIAVHQSAGSRNIRLYWH